MGPSTGIRPADSWVCIAAADETGLGERLSLDEMRRASWVHCFRHQPEVVPVLRDLQLYGRHDVATVVVESFMVAPALVAATARLAIVPARIAAASAAPIRVLPLPRPVPPLVQNLWWYAAHERDPAHRWLREIVVGCGRKRDDTWPTPLNQVEGLARSHAGGALLLIRAAVPWSESGEHHR